MPSSYPISDPDFKRFPPGGTGKRYLQAFNDLRRLKEELVMYDRIDPAYIAALRSTYVKASDLCARLQGELERSFHWPE